MTIIEVMAGALILGIVALVVNSYLLIQQTMALRQERQGQIQDAIMANIAEIHGKKPSILPVGSCWSRTYSPQGHFIAEQVDTLASATCSSDYATTAGEIKVTVRFRSGISPSANINFNPSAFLKMPTSGTSLIEIEVLGSYKPLKGEPAPPLTLTIYKRTA